jgi:hypothetical protein
MLGDTRGVLARVYIISVFFWFTPLAGALLCTPGFVAYRMDNGTDTCQGCIAGTYQTGFGMTFLADCERCPSGTYQTGLGMGHFSNCTPCGQGTYQPLVGQAFSGVCLLCEAGEHQTALGATSATLCAKCEAGTYQPARGGAGACIACPRGHYGTASGLAKETDACLPCPAGAYQSLLGAVNASACLACAAGTYQPWPNAVSQDDCIWCPTGTYQPHTAQTRADACVKCPLGTYQQGLAATSAADCTECGVGTYQSGVGGASGAEDCLLCPAGTYQPSPRGGGLGVCLLCAAGSYQPDLGATAQDACFPCSAGTFQTASGSDTGGGCLMCPKGSYQPRKGAGNASLCLRCPSGTFHTGVGAVSPDVCEACGRGMYSTGLGMGHEGVCLQCLAGTFQSDALHGADKCTRCAPGTYQVLPGQSACTECGVGTYQPFAGVSVDWWCKPCDPGTFGNVTGAASSASCLPCPEGAFSLQPGQTTCQPCDVGRYSPAPRSPLCFSCMGGTFTNTTGSTRCIGCAVGASLSVSGGSACTLCTPGGFQFQNSSRECIVCPVGKHQSAHGATSCASCSEGYFQSSPNHTGCDECLPGSFSDSEGVSHCTPCAGGTFRAAENRSTACLPCGEGAFQRLAGQSGCDLCERGHYSSTPGPTFCAECTPGEFQTSAGASSCDQCLPGSYRDEAGGWAWDSCFNCSAGTYSDTGGATRCTSCDPGAYSVDPGATKCFRCGHGAFQTSPAASGCNLCPPGTSSSEIGLASREGCAVCPLGASVAVSGAARCDACPVGTFSAAVGAVNCSACKAGTFMDEAGWKESACFPCPAGTFSGVFGAFSSTVCELCPDGYSSNATGRISADACLQCTRGTVSVAGKNLCRPCIQGEFCPAGYHTPIRCVPGLRCNGTHMEGAPGMLPFLRGNCTGAIPCPQDGRCTRLMGLAEAANQTHFVVYEGGGTILPLSCPGQSLNYGTARLDWPAESNFTIPVAPLYRLAPLACPVGMYLLRDACTSCPKGTFSSSLGALAAITCIPCPAGTFQSTVGGSACTPCPVGGYCGEQGLSAWFACRPGTFQSSQGQTTCIPCSAGTFTSAPRSTACTVCSAGSFQPDSGGRTCLQCQPTHFSSAGDHACSPCGSNLASLDPGFSCVPAVLPAARDGVAWITVSGDAGAADQCLSTGSVPASALASVNQLAASYVLMTRRPGACVSTLSVVDQPALTRQWTNQVGHLRRPVSIRVIPFNQTFYYDLCRHQGFAVLFTVSDEFGEMATDMTGGSAVMTVLDSSGRHVLFSMACERIPNDVNAKVPLGVCKTTFCPTVSVWVRVAVQWAQSLSLPRPQAISAQTLLSPGPVGVCVPSSVWMAGVELVASTVPHYPGATFDVRIRVLNAPAHASLAVFRFALRVLGGVTLSSVQSTYSVVTERVGDVVIVVGDASQGGGDVLATMRFRVGATTSGVALFAQVVPQSFQFTLVNAVPYVMAVRGSGFSCRDDGYIDILLDFPRATALIANRRRPYVINWRRIQASALDSPTAIHVIAVGNTMNHFAPADATCTSVDPRHFDIASCDVIRGGNVGNQNGSVLVSFQTVTLRVSLESWVPTTTSFGVAVTAGGMSGRYRIRTTLSSGDRAIHGVDATPYLPALLSFGVALNTRQGLWRCDRLGRRFTIGTPTVYTALCGDSLLPTPLKSPSGFFLVSGTMTGVTALGSYVFPPAVISGNAPTGTLLLFSPAGTSIGIHNASLGSTSSRLSAREGTLTLRNTGESARCVFFDIHPIFAQQWGSLTGRIPVFPGGPLSLDIALSTSVILAAAPDDPGDSFMPTTVFVVRAFLVFSDGSRLSVQDDPRLMMASNTLDVSGLAATAKATTAAANNTLVFSIRGITCVSTSLPLRVVPSSVLQVSLVCPACPEAISLEDDPLSLQLPTLFPSSFLQSLVLVRRLLADGRIVYRAEPLHIVSGASVLSLTDTGRVVAKSVGTASLSTVHTPGETIDITVVYRWTSDIQFLCNGSPCVDVAGDLRLAPRGDGASLPPFAYPTTLTVALYLTLFNGSTFSPSWLEGISLLVNGTESSTAVLHDLWFGPMDLGANVTDDWGLDSAHGLADGVRLRVERLALLLVHGPDELRQIHCSGFWEEGPYTATGALSDGTAARQVPATFDGTGPMVAHDRALGLFHAVSGGDGTVIAAFGGFTAELTVHALQQSVFFSGASIDSLPSVWTGVRGALLHLLPVFTPALLGGGWFPAQQVAARVLQWTSSDPGVIEVTLDNTGLVLRADWFQPVTVTGTFRQCDTLPVQPSAVTRTITVNVASDTMGALDVGNPGGLPLPPTPVGASLDIPLFVYVRPLEGVLQSYLLDVEVVGSGLEATSCMAGLLPNSQCAVTGQRARYVGAFSDSQLSGRILLGTVRGTVLLDALAVIHGTLVECVVNGELLQPRAIEHVVRLGVAPLVLSSVGPATMPPRRVLLPGGSNPTARLYGDTDGDGAFTPMDVLFMEKYMGLGALTRPAQVCVLKAACQSTARLSAWQLQQLKPVRNPNMPSSLPDGSDVLFLLMALVGKTFFLAGLEVETSAGKIEVRIDLRDFEQTLNPPNAVVRLGLTTSLNRGVAFDAAYVFIPEASTVIVTCRRVGTLAGFQAASLHTSRLVDEPSVGLRVELRSLDERGSQLSASGDGRRFVFAPSGPIMVFNIMGSSTSFRPPLNGVAYIPTLNCEFLCEDASLFLDGTVGTPEWLTETTVRALSLATHPLVFRAAWWQKAMRQTPVMERPSVVAPFQLDGGQSQGPDLVVTGDAFNLTFALPSPGDEGYEMALYSVAYPSATGLQLLRVLGGDAVLPANNAPPPSAFLFFAGLRGLGDGAVTLLFRVIGEGSHTVTVNMVESSSASAAPDNPVLRRVVHGVRPPVTHARLTPWCAEGAILWSRLVPKARDEPCKVDVVAYEADGRERGRMTLECIAYPCVLQVFGYAARPTIKLLTPVAARLVVQRAIVSVGHRTQWRLLCDMADQPNVTATESALREGLITSAPENALAITTESIRGVRPGAAVVSFGEGLASAFLNVTTALNPPARLLCAVFTGIELVFEQAPLAATTAVFETPSASRPLLAGSIFYLLLSAVYDGGYSLLLDPTPGVDGISLSPESDDVSVSHLDGSIFVSAMAGGGIDIPLLRVVYQGVSVVVRGTVVPLTPAALELCCDVVLAGPSSNLHGRQGFRDSFVMPPPTVLLADGKVRANITRLDDSALRVEHDPDVLVYNHSSGVWSLTSNAPPSGSTLIAVTYTHPKTLFAVTASVRITMVAAATLHAEGPVSLRRVHCSPSVFESARVTASLRVLDGLDEIDVTDEITMHSSSPGVLAVTSGPGSGVLTGLSVGTAQITVTVRGLSDTLTLSVLDESVVVRSIAAPVLYDLVGVRGSTRFPLSLNGTLGTGGATVDLAFLASFAMSPSAHVSLDEVGRVLTIRSTSFDDDWHPLHASIPPCAPLSPDGFSQSSLVRTRAVAEAGTTDLEIVRTRDRLDLVLVAGTSLLSFYVRIRTDAIGFASCAPMEGLPVFSDCVFNQPPPATGDIVVAGAMISTPFSGARLGLVSLVPQSAVTTLWGFVEVFDGVSTLRFPVRAGLLHGLAGGSDPAGGNQSVSLLLMPTQFPVVDASVLFKTFGALFVRPRAHTVRDAVFQLALLVGRQMLVDARVYSNEFELSIMFFIMDRFLQPVPGNTTVIRVLIHSDQLDISGSTPDAQTGGRWLQAARVLDGLYAVELRQKIPVMSLAISFTVASPASEGGAWSWRLASPVDVGQPLPVCPRSAAHTATFLASYDITIPSEYHVNATDLLFDDIEGAGLLRQVACSLQVATRRVLLQQGGAPHTLRLTVAMESLTRVHQANLVLMGGWFADEFQRRVDRRAGAVPANAGPNRSSLITIERGQLSFVNDSGDPPRPCPEGYYFSRNGTYVALPPHAITGQDCYDMFCLPGFTAATFANGPPTRYRCIPTPVPVDIIWVCVTVILTAVLALAALACCVKFALWTTAKDVADVMFDPALPDETVPVAVIAPQPVSDSDTDDLFEEKSLDLAEDRPHAFLNIVTGSGMDDLSSSLMMNEDGDDAEEGGFAPFERSYRGVLIPKPLSPY